MRDLQKNDVPATNQVKKSVFIHENSGIRILFAGNSITKHSPRPEMGWTNDCGMAASDIDHDYVHLLLDKIRGYDKNAAWAIAQVGGYEANLFNGAKPSDHHSEAADFDADIIIMFYGANTPKTYESTENAPRTFESAYEEMRCFLNKSGKAKIIHCQGFYVRPVLDAEKKAVCEKYGDVWVSLGDIGTREDTHGRFNHPSDLGMQIIAESIWEKTEPVLKEILF
ncbi:MAG: SGNH/GDSL hydrolase family protein [Clostridia bacterium]|nr:SGNH/GDSL hydrolase family protein [Clostridia bacterium]